MAIKYTIAQHGMCWEAKIKSAIIGHVFNIECDKDIDNGQLVALGDYINIDEYKAKDPTSFSGIVEGKSARGNWYVRVTDPGDSLLVRTVPVSPYSNFTEDFQSEKAFYNAQGSMARALELAPYDVIEVSEECFDGMPEAKKTVSVENRKMKIADV